YMRLALAGHTFCLQNLYAKKRMERKTYLKLAALFLVIIYTVGRIGLVNEKYSAQFQEVTWLNLVITAILTFAFHRNYNRKFVLTCFGIFAAGFFIEWIGVRTGVIFGEYKYGETLGLKLDEIPLLIGLNWLVLVYCVHNILHMWKLPKVLSPLSGACLLVLLDFFLEPFAIKYNLWLWNNNAVPVQNYIAWFIVSFIMLWTFNLTQKEKNVNTLAVFVYFLQLAFFVSFFFC
ncbi:MAG: carotenoid biosynthesis protein, partial [Sphingobacteriales bacterium]